MNNSCFDKQKKTLFSALKFRSFPENLGETETGRVVEGTRSLVFKDQVTSENTQKKEDQGWSLQLRGVSMLREWVIEGWVGRSYVCPRSESPPHIHVDFSS